MKNDSSAWIYGAALLLTTLLSGCGGAADVSKIPLPGGSTSAPSVSSITPANNAQNVALNGAITATFSTPVEATSVNSDTFTMSNGVTGNVTCDGVNATFTPDTSLASGTTYFATLTTGVKSSGGVPMASNYQWTFKTGTTSDTTPPTVSNTDPANGATGVATNAAITVTFSETVKASTVNTSTFTLWNGPNAVTGTVSVNGSTATFTPASALANGTAYTAKVSTGVTDLAGNAKSSDTSWSFTTSAAVDTTPPTVSSTNPASGATGIAPNAAVTASFSENMTASTVTTSTFTLKNGGTSVAGSVTYNGTTATFTPTSALANSTTYTATITTGVKDAAGNAMASAKTWTFTTSAAADTTPPTVVSTSPANSATGVATGASITASFSENMTPSTLSTSSFTLMNGNTSVAGSVTYSGTTATFTPSSALSASTQYTATLTTAVKDLAGNAMTSAKTWTFTTGSGAVSSAGWLYTKAGDSKIYVNNGAGEQVWVGRGVNVDDLFLGGYNDTLGVATATAEQGMKDAMSILVNQWKANFVRVNIGMYSYKTVSWLSNPAEYKTPMENIINAMLANPKVYVLVTLRSDTSMENCNINNDDAVCVPTANTDAVYRALVDSFADKPNVMFGVSNEPGGMDYTDAQLRAAMSHAVDTIRAEEDKLGVQHHLVSVQGNSWTSELGAYHTTPLTQDRIVYEYHAYPPFSDCNAHTDCYGWSNIPVIIGEYGGAGWKGMSQSVADTFYADVEARQMSNLAWTYSPYSNVNPDLLNVTGDGANISPNAWGTVVKNYLTSHAQ